jgi:hypothetical protein
MQKLFPKNYKDLQNSRIGGRKRRRPKIAAWVTPCLHVLKNPPSAAAVPVFFD